MNRRFENAAAWALSQEDPAMRATSLGSVKRILSILGDVVSFTYAGETDKTSTLLTTTLGSANRFFPMTLHQISGAGESFEVRLDYIEDKTYSDTRVRNLSAVKQHSSSDAGNRISLSPFAIFLDGVCWILLPESIVHDIQDFLTKAFRFGPLRDALKMDSLTESQKLSFEDSVIKIAIEMAIHHELGHIHYGHGRVEGISFLKFVSGHPDLGDTNCLEWTTAKEMAADDYAGQSLAYATMRKKFLTFAAEDALLEIGPFSFINALFVAACTYYFIQNDRRLVDNETSSAKAQPATNDAIEPLSGGPPCGDSRPCLRSGRCENACRRAGYPTVTARLRFFYMAVNDSFKNEPEFEDYCMKGFQVLSSIVRPLTLFAIQSNNFPPHIVAELTAMFSWLSLSSDPQVTFIAGAEGGVTLSTEDQEALAKAQASADAAEQVVVAELESMYAIFKRYEPHWQRFNNQKQAVQYV